MLLSADILPQNTMYSNIRYDEPRKLGVRQLPNPPPLSTPLAQTYTRTPHTHVHTAMTHGTLETPCIAYPVSSYSAMGGHSKQHTASGYQFLACQRHSI